MPFLLNVGPTGEGVIPPPAVAELRQVGRRLRVNGEALYGTKGSSIGRPSWGRVTEKDTPAGHIFYLHVFDWPANGELVVPGIADRSSRRSSSVRPRRCKPTPATVT